MSAPSGFVRSWGEPWKAEEYALVKADLIEKGLLCGCHNYEFESKHSRDSHHRWMSNTGNPVKTKGSKR